MRWAGVGVAGEWSDCKGAVGVVVDGDVGVGSQVMLFDPIRGETEGCSLAGKVDFADGKRMGWWVGVGHYRTFWAVKSCA